MNEIIHFGFDEVSSTTSNEWDDAKEHTPQHDRTPRVLMGFKHFSVASSGKMLLQDVTGSVPAYGITAVLGPSASGKSVLLKSLSGRLCEITNATMYGSVAYKGQETNYTPARRTILFSPQTNTHLIGVLTVRETFAYSARLRFPHRADHARKVRYMNE